MNFEYCLKHILKTEKGFVNHPDDRGGPTNLGITMGTLAKWRGRPVTVDEVRDLDPKEAAEIYRTEYWDPLRLDEVISPKIRLILFDQAVNRGPHAVAKMTQAVLNEKYGQQLAIDGIIGARTLMAINSFAGAQLARKLIQASQTHYVQVAKNDPRQLVFLQGWMNRTFELMDLVA